MVVAMASSSELPIDDANGKMSDADEVCQRLEFHANRLLDKIATVTPEALFKSLQIDDPDLSFSEKRQIGGNILIKSPSAFLARFGKFLNVEDLAYFDQFARHDYAVQFYASEIRDRHNPAVGLGTRGRAAGHGCTTGNKVGVLVKNRRYEALKRLIEKGEYFSDCEMKSRNPLMFDQLVGQYMSSRELNAMAKIDNAEIKLSTILMEHMDRDEERSLRRRQQALDDVEEDESSSDEEDQDHDCGRSSPITDHEKHMFREEFLSNMYQSFLDGNDADFNYSSVDDNTDFDSVDATQQDAEDSYFDAEDPKTISSEVECAADEFMDYDAPIQNFVKS